jgi:LacI family transcriptional regulator
MTIKDIAEMAHVSKGTVSRAINGIPGVGQETRRRILKLIESLDFHPNAAARGLAAKRTHALGFVIPHTGRYSMTSTFWPALLISITEQAALRGISVLLSTAKSEDDVDSAFRSIFMGRQIDGAIIGAEQIGEKQLAELLVKGLPFVMVGRGTYISPYTIDVDNESGAYTAVQHMIRAGHRTIAMLGGPNRFYYVQERVRGFTRAMIENGMDPSLISFSSYEPRETQRKVSTILADNPSVSALFVAAGDLVFETMRTCLEAGRRVPQDLSIVSFDDHPFFEHFTPPVTAVSQPIEKMAQKAVEMLLTLIDGREPEEKAVVLPPALIERGSCQAPGLGMKSTASHPIQTTAGGPQ